MLQRLDSASILIIGAMVAFILFTVLLFVIEKRGTKKQPVRKQVAYTAPPKKHFTPAEKSKFNKAA